MTGLLGLHPAVAVLGALVLAAACFALGTFRGSWRVWLAGYTLTVLALVLAFAGLRAERRAQREAHRAAPAVAPTTPATPAVAPATPASAAGPHTPGVRP